MANGSRLSPTVPTDPSPVSSSGHGATHIGGWYPGSSLPGQSGRQPVPELHARMEQHSGATQAALPEDVPGVDCLASSPLAAVNLIVAGQLAVDRPLLHGLRAPGRP